MDDVSTVQNSFSIARDLNLVTIYAAFVATIVFCWQVAVYLREGGRLRVRVNPNMKTIGGGRSASKECYIVVNAVNVGTADTTITNVVLAAYDSRWERLRRKASFNAIVAGPSETQPLPYVLEVGRQYMGMMIQDAEIERISREKLLYMGVAHVFSSSVKMARIKPIQMPAG